MHKVQETVNSVSSYTLFSSHATSYAGVRPLVFIYCDYFVLLVRFTQTMALNKTRNSTGGLRRNKLIGKEYKQGTES